jgi:hypothetical protein
MFGGLRGLLFDCAAEGPQQDISAMTSPARG